MKILVCLFVLSGLSTLGSAIDLSEKISRINENDEITLKISRCTEIVAKILFVPSNDISIVSSDESHHPEIVSKILATSFVNRVVRIFTKLADANDASYINNRDTSIVLIENRANLREIMENRMVERWAEYIIVTEASFDWFKEFSRLLRYSDFYKVAFIGTNTNGTNTLFASAQNSKDSMSRLKSYDICQNVSFSSKTSNLRKNHLDDSTNLKSFSSWAQIRKKSNLSYALIDDPINIPDGSTGPDAMIADKSGDIGADIIEIFAAKYNFEILPRVWDKQNGSTWTEAMKRCVKGEFDYFFSTLLPPENLIYNDDIRAVTWFRFESLVFFDSVKIEALPITSLLAPFADSVWLYSLGAFVLFVFFVWMIGKLWHRGLMNERITILDLWATSFNQSLSSTPTKFALRFVLGMWLVRTLILNGGYSSAFSTSMIAANQHYRLRTFEDILNSERSICGGVKAWELLNHETDRVILEVHDRFEVMHLNAVFDAVINESYIGSHRISDVRRYNWKNRADYSRQFYTLDNILIAKYPVFYYARKHHPYNTEFNRIISIIRDTGISEKLRGKYIGWLTGARAPDYSILPAEKHLLGMKQLLGAFQFLLVGHFVSGIVLIIEIIVYKRRMKKLGECN